MSQDETVFEFRLKLWVPRKVERNKKRGQEGLPGRGIACTKAQRFRRMWYTKATVAGGNEMPKEKR